MFAHTGRCYRHFAQKKSWRDARTACRARAPGQDGDLASIHDRATNRFVSQLAPGAAWVGGRQTTGRGWQWSDGSRWGFESWARGQPDNGGVWGAEDFLGVNFRRKGRWNDWPLNGHDAWISPVNGFVCQHKVKSLIFQEVNSPNGMPKGLLLEPPTATILKCYI